MATGIQRELSVEDQYGFIKQIGKGSYGDIWLVVPISLIATSTRYVLKRLDLQSITDEGQEIAEREANLLSTLKHPNIVTYVESFRSWDSHLNIVMHYCDGGDLVLGDVGNLATTIIGTPYYMSPEIFSNTPYDQKTDIWSLGCCMYEIVNLHHAFEATDMNSLVIKILRGRTPQIHGNYSDELKQIIKATLSKRPENRPTAENILKNRYIKQHIVQMLENIKRRLENDAQRKQLEQQSPLTLPSKSQFTDPSSTNNITTKSMTDLSISESRARRRQKNSAKSHSPSHTIVEPSTAVAVDADDVFWNANVPEVREQYPVEKLRCCFEQREKMSEDNYQHCQINNEFTGLSNSAPNISNINTKQKATPPVKFLPLPLATEIVPVEDSKQTNYRYFDIGDLPDQTLLPITGYNKKSLTSLENAVRDVEHLLEDIQVKIIIAKKNVQKCRGILSIDESAAIQLYTMETLPLDRCLYYNLNKTLRTANRRELEPWFSYLKLLLTALYKLPSVRRTVWRGIKNVDLSSEYQEGQCYTWWNFSSCTDTLTVMQTTQFLGTKGLRTLFAIECENGKEIKDYSYVRKENEILLPPAMYIEVLGKINPAPDLHIIHVRETSPPYVMISPPF
ncbi:unnamed protein product [Rotaria sordida]|uniref:NAD(P)(+)--arginine ADP-ribosyltransferase n=2 Tax=Rotaria sordida TaxID=392033 RepID=A0A814WZY1_9BILA|nr:unnamed protein product [Rotaria sordida]